ncbi:MAG TPA: multicopper oxidase family protein [Vicinamibacterales bacterium]|nr:multicopper oxidase family protein [Vicinamibacterales bacterium]
MRARVIVVSVVVAVLALVHSAGAQTPSSFAPAGWDAEFTLHELPDRNPDPRVLEIDLTARVADVDIAPKLRVTAWTYDGRLPGPLIRAKVGDRLIVHFTNQLPEPSTVHWHGVRVPIEMDGVPGISQPAVKPGETFTYDFVLRDAGLYWYHPHHMSAAQVGFGLYGALLVDDPDDSVGVADQLTMVLSDISFDRKGALEAADSGGAAGDVFGREGEHVLVNGRKAPVLRVRSGAPQRWRIVNTARSRYFLLDLQGQKFTVIGTDGGLQERPTTSEVLLITPGERVDVIVAPTGTPGSELPIYSMLYNRGYGSVEYRSIETVLTLAFSQDPTMATPPMPQVSRVITPPSAAGARRVDLTLGLPPMDARGRSEFQVNGVAYPKAKPYLAGLGETQLWVINNDTKWDHPFHLHGYFFMPVDEKGEPIRPMAWKDTINIPMNTIARVLVAFDERPGTWMFHCHILDHAEIGLMGTVHVGPSPPAEHSHSH